MRVLTSPRPRTRALLASLSTALLIFFSGTAQASPGAGMPPGMRSGTIAVDGGTLYYETAGSGETLVLIHDGMIHSEGYDAQFAPFAERYTVVRYDRRGYGRSSASQSPFSNVDDLLRVFEELKIEKAMLLGTSAGGRLCVDFTLAHPDRVKALVLVGAVVSGLGYTDHFFTRGGHITAADRADVRSQGLYYTLKDPYEFGPDSDAARQRAKALIEAYPHNLDDGTDRLAQPPTIAAVRNLAAIRVPTLIIVGEYDIPDVHAHGGALEAGIRGSRRIIIRGAGHLVAMERPEEFNAAVLGFLRAADVFQALQGDDAARAVSLLRRSHESDPNVALLSEGEVNQAGYRYLQQGRSGDAIEFFRLNAEMHPESWNVWDSLGEGQAAAGDTEAALASYRKSLEINPGSESGKQAVPQLEERRRLEAGETKEGPRFAPGQDTGLNGPYLGQKPPGLVPEIFAPGIISTRGSNEFGVTFSPDGREIYFSRVPDIYVSRWTKGGWAAPAPVPFNTPQLDHEPHVTRDGKRLFFGSARPRPEVKAGEDPYGIWVAEREGDGWGAPRYHGPGMYVTTTARGDIYVTDITPPDGRGILRQRLVDGRYGPSERVEGGPNSPDLGVHPCIAPDERFLVFDVYEKGAWSGADLKVSFRRPDGAWGEAIDLGDAVNTDSEELAASLSPDGRYLFFSRNRDVYWVSAEIIERLRPPTTK